MPYSPTVAELSLQLLPSVRKAFGLAQHGAVYAAQTEFIQVLRRIAQAKDAAEGVGDHSRALAVGLRALDEADDFVPQGAQLEGELNVPVVASAHRTPVLGSRHANVRPDEAIALYHQYAREQLARAVSGERAGSMALYGLGKVQNRLAYESEGELRHERKALVMFQAALGAGPGNHLAANEIGVLFARGGQPVEASAMFRQAIDVAPTSTSYHNLAVVERSLGQHEQAAANEKYAQYLAARDRAAGSLARRSGVEWVSPQDLSRVAQPLPIPGGNERVVNEPGPAPRQPARLPSTSSPVQTVAKWPQKLVPGIFRR
jgi:tetratricopeptide (TPR) repeat protein